MLKFKKVDATTYSTEDGRFVIRAEVRTRTSAKHGTVRKVTGWTVRDRNAGRSMTGLSFTAAKLEADAMAEKAGI